MRFRLIPLQGISAAEDPVDIFQLRDQIIADYTAYTRSFLSIRHPQIAAFVQEALAHGRLWPDALIQLSPAYETDVTVADLAQSGVLHPRCADIFRASGADAPSLILPRTTTAMMNRFLAHVAAEFADYFIVMQVDQAAWHRSKQLQIPENIRLVPQLPRSPELNPVEHIWDYLRKHAMRNTLFHSLDKVTNALITGLRDLAADGAALTSMTFFPHLRMV
jgi:hypothetical protein